MPRTASLSGYGFLAESQAGLSRRHFLPRIDTIAPHPLQFLNTTCQGSSLVERRPEKAGVASSILAPGTILSAISRSWNLSI